MTLPATIISGFLGAGKTTLLNHLLRNPGSERLAVLVNDFGAINIDRELVSVETKNQIELTNGCVCCSIQDDLASGLVAVSRTSQRFTRVVLECSGISHPAGVLKVFGGPPISDLFEVDGIFCLIDAASFMDLDFQSTELAIDQAATADLVLLNKSDLVSRDALNEVRQVLQDAQQSMKIVNVVQAELSPDILFGNGEIRKKLVDNDGKMPFDHPEMYESVAYRWQEAVELAAFENLVRALPPRVLRGKGILNVQTKGGEPARKAVFQLVGKRSSVEIASERGHRDSEVVLIARRGELDHEALRAALEKCPGSFRVPPVGRQGRSRRVPVCD